MVVTPMLQHGVTVNLPKDLNNPEEDPRIIKDTSIVISIPEDGAYYIGKDKISKEMLKEKVQKMLDNVKKEEDKVVYIKSGTGVSYGDVVTVINEVRALGIDKIGLVADKKKGSGETPAAPAPQPAA
jgi:biopolymer transport protein ExbD